MIFKGLFTVTANTCNCEVVTPRIITKSLLSYYYYFCEFWQVTSKTRIDWGQGGLLWFLQTVLCCLKYNNKERVCLIGDSLLELEFKKSFSFLKDNCERNIMLCLDIWFFLKIRLIEAWFYIFWLCPNLFNHSSIVGQFNYFHFVYYYKW